MSLTGQPVRQKDPPPLRDKAHIAFVKAKPCLICGRQPSQAHHVRLGLRTMGKRKCDSKCVPLCVDHHFALHYRSGTEEGFWWGENWAHDKVWEQAAKLWHERTKTWPEWHSG